MQILFVCCLVCGMPKIRFVRLVSRMRGAQIPVRLVSPSDFVSQPGLLVDQFVFPQPGLLVDQFPQGLLVDQVVFPQPGLLVSLDQFVFPQPGLLVDQFVFPQPGLLCGF